MRIVLALALLQAGVAAAGPPQRQHLAAVDIPTLERAFIECDHRSMQTMLSAAEAAICSMVFEDLKQRGFEGDFGKFMAWWRIQRGRAAAPQP